MLLLRFLQLFLNGINHAFLLFLVLRDRSIANLRMRASLLLLLHFLFKFCDPGVQFFDDSLGEVRSLSQLLLHLLVNLQLLLQLHDRCLQLFIFEDDLLGLLALVFELTSKLVVLQHGQTSGGLQFLLFETQQVLTHFPDLVSHL